MLNIKLKNYSIIDRSVLTLNKSKQILMIAPRFHPSIGGVEKHVFEVAQKLTERGFVITVITTSHEKGLKRFEVFKGISILRFPYMLEKNFIGVVVWMLRQRHMFSKYDIIHIHDPVPLVFWCSILRVIVPQKPLHITFHGFERDPIPLVFKILRLKSQNYCFLRKKMKNLKF